MISLLVCACLFAATVQGAGGGGGAQNKEGIWASPQVLNTHVNKHASGNRGKYINDAYRLYCSCPVGSSSEWKESYWNGHRNWVWNTQTATGRPVCLVLDDNGKVRSSHRGHGAVHPQGNAASETSVSGDFKKDFKKDTACTCDAECLKIPDEDLELWPTDEEAESMLKDDKQ